MSCDLYSRNEPDAQQELAALAARMRADRRHAGREQAEADDCEVRGRFGIHVAAVLGAGAGAAARRINDESVPARFCWLVRWLRQVLVDSTAHISRLTL